jgi:hypothetical protein
MACGASARSVQFMMNQPISRVRAWRWNGNALQAIADAGFRSSLAWLGLISSFSRSLSHLRPQILRVVGRGRPKYP